MKTNEPESKEPESSQQEDPTKQTKKFPDPGFSIEVVGGPTDNEGRPAAGSPPRP